MVSLCFVWTENRISSLFVAPRMSTPYLGNTELSERERVNKMNETSKWDKETDG